MIDKNIPTIVLCGGIGTRLREETEFKPKPMVRVGDNPLLWHIMKIYSHYGFNDFLIALGYKGEMIKEHFYNNNHDDFNITMVDTGQESLTGERIRRLKKHVKEDTFMVTYGDGVADIDVGRLIKFHLKKGKIATITGVHPISRWGLVNVDEYSLVTKLDQKPMLYDYVNGGFMVFNKKMFNFLREGDMIEDVLSRLVSQKELALYKHEGFWYGMDTYRDFLYLNELWKKDPKWKIWK